MGGLGIRIMANVNTALLAKLGWQIVISANTPWVKAITAKYLEHNSFWDVSLRALLPGFGKAFSVLDLSSNKASAN